MDLQVGQKFAGIANIHLSEGGTIIGKEELQITMFSA
jgi:hypothetical protein